MFPVRRTGIGADLAKATQRRDRLQIKDMATQLKMDGLQGEAWLRFGVTSLLVLSSSSLQLVQ
jgi:hypothetical protein